VTSFRLVLRSLIHRWRTNLAVALGAAAAAAVLAGALGAGDSVRFTLRHITLERLGSTQLALEPPGRYFRAELADEVASELGGRGAALVLLRGQVGAGELRVPSVQVLGVSSGFWELAAEPADPALGPGDVALNEPLAARLSVGPGQEVLLRVPAASAMPGEAPLAVGEGDTASLRLTVKAIVKDTALGSFGLRANQARPLNAFVSRDVLASRIGKAGRANTLLLASVAGRAAAEADAALAARWRLADAGLSLRQTGADWELLSERVFIEQPVEDAALAAGGRGVLTYFVDSINTGRRSISYCFVAAAGAGRTGGEPGGQEVDLNAWAARELGAAGGDVVRLEYMLPGPEPGSPLERRSAQLRVRKVLAIETADRALMPEFPGLAGVKNCRDWSPGVPLDPARIGARDQAYWDEHGGSPKAFVSLSAAQGMWSSRYGRLTSVRFDGPVTDLDAIRRKILERLGPASLGFSFSPVRDSGLAASAQGVDFGQLFLGLSLFLIAAALLLTALLFVLSVEQRAGDVRTLMAVGFTRGKVTRLLAAEGALVAAAGSLAGIPLGLAYHRGILAGLQGAWQDAVRTRGLLLHVEPVSLLLGCAGGFLAALLVIGAAAARGTAVRRASAYAGTAPRARRGPVLPTSAWVAAACAAGAAGAIAFMTPPESFFLSGAILLVGSLAVSVLLLGRAGRPRSAGTPGVLRLGMANAARRRTRSLAVASLAACGIFIVGAVGANRPAVHSPERRESGTGGFSLIAETSLPVPGERERTLFPPGGLPAAAGFRVLEGEDASCLNLNRAGKPRLLGVRPSLLEGRFTFATLPEARPNADPWSVLEQDLGPGTIPAVADQSVITWGLGLRLGDELEYRDERGEPLRVRLAGGLANSVLQGSIIVAESALAAHFPSLSGHGLLLVEAPPGGRARVQEHLARSLSTLGVSVTPAADRLAEFNSVEGAYLAVFALLGWLGMLVGTLGLAVVVVRNVAESRGELALLRAVGLGRPALLRLVLAENLLPLALGLGAGLLASAVAVAPAASSAGAAQAAASMLAPVGAILACALACICTAAAVALRAELLPALREE
jgi:putative ABC transport system permease protein